MFVLRQLLCRHSDMHQALLRLLFNCSLRKANEHDKMCPSGLFLLTGAGKEGKAFGQGHELGQASLNEPVGQEARRGSGCENGVAGRIQPARAPAVEAVWPHARFALPANSSAVPKGSHAASFSPRCSSAGTVQHGSAKGDGLRVSPVLLVRLRTTCVSVTVTRARPALTRSARGRLGGIV